MLRDVVGIRRIVYRACLKALFLVEVSGTKILHFSKCSFSECNGNDENVCRTFEVVDSRFAVLQEKRLKKVGNPGVY